MRNIISNEKIASLEELGNYSLHGCTLEALELNSLSLGRIEIKDCTGYLVVIYNVHSDYALLEDLKIRNPLLDIDIKHKYVGIDLSSQELQSLIENYHISKEIIQFEKCTFNHTLHISQSYAVIFKHCGGKLVIEGMSEIKDILLKECFFEQFEVNDSTISSLSITSLSNGKYSFEKSKISSLNIDCYSNGFYFKKFFHIPIFLYFYCLLICMY